MYNCITLPPPPSLTPAHTDACEYIFLKNDDEKIYKSFSVALKTQQIFDKFCYNYYSPPLQT